MNSIKKTIKNIQIYLKNVKVYNKPLDECLGLIGNILVIPVFTAQIIKVISRGKANDYSIFFILLQLIGSPEGGGALITGLIKKKYTITIIGGYGLIYYLIVLFYYLFPRNIAK